MNKVVLLGRLTAKPELRYTPSNVAFLRFTVAVNRPFANKDGNREADFINVVCWRIKHKQSQNTLIKAI